MTYETAILISQYASRGVLVDSNILLLYFVGMVRRDRISQFPRTEHFTSKDFDLLITFLSEFTTVATTPNILTEVSSFINKLGEPDRSSCYEIFALQVSALSESYIPSQDIASTDWFFSVYGLSDCTMASLAKSNQYLVLTDDLKMASFLHLQEVDTINFNDLRLIIQF